MAKIRIDEADGFAVRDVVHAKLSAVEATSTIGLDEPAATGRDLALRSDARRVPVVDDDGHLV